MAKREAILHIGTWKTGTTSIQFQLSERRQELIEQGAAFPRSPGARTCILLTYMATSGPRRPEEAIWDGMEPRERLNQFAREFAEEMEGLPPHVDRVIFSDERLCVGLKTQEEIQKLRDFLTPWFDRFAIVLYVRRQDQFMASLYSQFLRGGAIEHPTELCVKPRVLGMSDYRSLVSRWSDVFGTDAIRLRIYEKGEKNFDSVSDLFTLCGLRPPPPEAASDRRLNPSMNTIGQAVLRESGRKLFAQDLDPHVMSGQWTKLTYLVTSILPGKGWKPTQAEAKAIMTHFEKSNEALRQQYYPERASLFSNDFSDLPEEAPEMSDRDLFDAACAVLVEAVGGTAKPTRLVKGGVKRRKKFLKEGQKRRAGGAKRNREGQLLELAAKEA